MKTRTFLSTLALAGLTSACASVETHTYCMPAQPIFQQTMQPAPQQAFTPGFSPRGGETGSKLTRIADGGSLTTAIPLNAEIQVHYTGSTRYSGGAHGQKRLATRRCDRFIVREEGEMFFSWYDCLEVFKAGKALMVSFINDDGKPDVFNSAYFQGGYIEGKGFEQTENDETYFPGTKWPVYYGSRTAQPVEVVWSTNVDNPTAVCKS